MNEALLRQRRNVFISCALLWALSLGGVDMQELSLAGMKFGAFRNTHVFLFGLWIVFAYFVYRYLVYFVEFAAKDLAKTWNRELSRAVNPRIERLVRAAFTDHLSSPTTYEYEYLRRSKFAEFTWRGHVQSRTPDGNLASLEDLSLPIARWKILPWEFKGFFRFCTVTPAVTDHVLPFFVATATGIYCGFMVMWAGNLGILLF